MMYTIYLRTNKVTGMQYVGQTNNFKRREKKWKRLKQPYGSEYFNKERAKYGLENFETTVLAEVETQEESLYLEQFYIKKLNTKYPDGYNMGCGGKRNCGFSHSEESRQKMSEAKKGKYAGENAYWYGKKRPDVSESMKKPILQIDKTTGKVIKEWESATDVEIELGFKHQNISHCCKGKIKSAYGFKWRYE